MLPNRAEEMRTKWQRLNLELPTDHTTQAGIPQIGNLNTPAESKLVIFKSKSSDHNYATTNLPTSEAADETVKDSKPFNFFGLPFDIRRLIIKQMVGKHMRAAVFIERIGGGRINLVPMVDELTAARNKQLRLEGLLVTLMDTTWVIHDYPGSAAFQSYLKQISFKGIKDSTTLKTGFDAIHSLSFIYHYFPRIMEPDCQANNDIEFMRQCPNLRSVTILWANKPPYDAPIDLICTHYRIDRMLDLKELKVLTLKINEGCNVEGGHLKRVGRWFKSQFEERKRSVRVFVDSWWVKQEIVDPVDESGEEAAVFWVEDFRMTQLLNMKKIQDDAASGQTTSG